MAKWKDNVSFVLVEPTEGGNVGAAARAMKNMGFKDLRLVGGPEPLGPAAEAMARGAEDVLHDAKRFGSLKEAIADAALVVGTSRRRGKARGTTYPIAEAVAEVLSTARKNRVAVLMGRESRGLFNEETAECAFLLSVPTSAAHPSLNLAQAVLLVAYELQTASLGSRKAEPAGLATHEEQGAAQERMLSILDAVGYTKRGEREVGPRVRTAIKRTLGRAGLTLRELEILDGILTRIETRLRG